MTSLARNYPGIHLDTICLERPFSNFKYIEKTFGQLTALRRIFSQARRNGCCTLIVEDISTADEVLQEDADLCKSFNVTEGLRSKTHRLSFFGYCSEFIGYAIIRYASLGAWQQSWVYESIIQPERITNNFIRNAPKWKCCIVGNELEIQGYLYAQQNGRSNCCAHVAVRSAASVFLPGGDITYHAMNNLIGGYSGGGLSTQEIIKLIESTGATCFVGSFDATRFAKNKQPAPFQKYIYGSIESGYPAIVIFGVRKDSYHAIPVIGHTFNQDSWVPRAESGYFKVGESIRYIPSESWLSTFICHDDNFGSNYCLPRHYLHTGDIGSCEKCKKELDECDAVNQACVCHVIGTMPGEVKITPIEAEVIGAEYLFELQSHLPDTYAWGKRLKEYAGRSQLVLRPLLVEPKEYIHHLSVIKGWDNGVIDPFMLGAIEESILGDSFWWLIELSVSELFAGNKRKVGEVIIRATTEYRKNNLFENFVIARLPGYFALFASDSHDVSDFVFIPSGIEDHVSLFGVDDQG